MAERIPNALIKEFFLDARGVPDHKKTELLVIPNMNSSSHRSHLHQAAGVYRRLHHMSGNSGGSTTMYLGWDGDAVYTAANGSVPRRSSNRSVVLARPISRPSRAVQIKMPEEESDTEEESDREGTGRPEDEDIAEQHDEYFRHATGRKSLVGRYLVDDPDPSWDDLALDIHETVDRGIYIAHFYLGDVSGTMIITERKGVVNSYCDRENFTENQDDEDDSSEEEDGEDEETMPVPYSHNNGKRKATSNPSRPRKRVARLPNKKTFHVKWRGREAGENIIILDYNNDHSDTITTTSQYLNLAGDIGMGDYGGEFTAYEVSDVPETRPSSWSSVSRQAYDQENRYRWRR